MADDTSTATAPAPTLPPAMTGSMGSPLDSILKQRKADEAKSDAAAKGAEDEIKTERDDYAKFRKDNPYPVPKVQPWTQPPPPVDPVRAFGSWASSLGIIASVLTKAPLTSALNASAAAMNAIRSNDLAAYNEAEDAWSKNTDLALKQTEWEAKGYEHALDMMKDDHALGQAYWKTVAASAENHAAMMLGDAGIIEHQQNYQQTLAKFHEDGILNKEKLDEAKGLVEYRIATTKEAAAGLGMPPNTPLEKMPPQIQQAVAAKVGQYKAAQEGRKTTESMGAEEARSVEELVNSGMPREQAIAVVSSKAKGGGFTPEMGGLMAALAERGVSLPAGLRSREQQAQLYQGLIDRNPGKTPDEIADLIARGQIEFGAQKKETSTAAGMAGKVEVGLNEMEDFIPRARAASAKVSRGDWVPLTTLLQMADSSISDPDIKELKLRTNAVLNAYDVISARGGTDKDKRQHNRSQLLDADGPAAYDRALSVLLDEAKIAHKDAVKATRVPELENKPDAGNGSDSGDAGAGNGGWSATRSK